MRALRQIRDRCESHPRAPSTAILCSLVQALAQHRPFEIERLCDLDREHFEIALELLDDWRIQRAYFEREEDFLALVKLTHQRRS